MIPPSYKPLMDYCSAFYHLNILVGDLPPHNKKQYVQRYNSMAWIMTVGLWLLFVDGLGDLFLQIKLIIND